MLSQPAAREFDFFRATDTLSTALEVARESSCPTARWRDVLASKLFGAANFPPHAAVLFNVRSNKGYAIALNAAALWAAERKCGCLEIIMLLFGDYEALRMEIIPVVPEDHFGRALGSSCSFGRYWIVT